MIVTKEKLIEKLPEYRDEWVLIHPDQTVKDIIAEVLTVHDEFAPHYDRIALFFDGDDTEKICSELFDFCRENIEYREETEEDQTSALPTGILVRGFGDCKHYAGFCGGVLDALNRRGKNLKWKYRFASYDLFDRTPHHVFIVVDNDGEEIWIDPTPGSETKVPVYFVDKKIQAMPLRRNIAGFESGIIGLIVQPYTGNTINYSGTGKYNGVFDPYLGLHDYAEYESSSGTDFGSLASQINSLIAKGPHPGHQVDADFVKWVFDNNIRSWNFYYPAGVRPGFANTVSTILPSSWPKPAFTQDGRLIFDRNVAVDDYRNPEIHILTAALQDLINRYDPAPYPLKPRDVKLFSQEHPDMVNDTTANLFSERRGTSDVAKAVDTVLPIVATAAKFLGINIDTDEVVDWVNGIFGGEEGSGSGIDLGSLADAALKKFLPGQNVSYQNGSLAYQGQYLPVSSPTSGPGFNWPDVLAGGIAFAGAWLVINRKKKKKNFVVPIAAGALGYWLNSRYHFMPGFGSPATEQQPGAIPYSSTSGGSYATNALAPRTVTDSGSTSQAYAEVTPESSDYGIVKDYTLLDQASEFATA